MRWTCLGSRPTGEGVGVTAFAACGVAAKAFEDEGTFDQAMRIVNDSHALIASAYLTAQDGGLKFGCTNSQFGCASPECTPLAAYQQAVEISWRLLGKVIAIQVLVISGDERQL